jgi:serine/threonine-protein kinase HipA
MLFLLFLSQFIEQLKFFRLVMFNFLFSNGDAHLKNFSILETKDGDFRLAPAYDLLDTRIHIDNTEFALDKGLFNRNKYKKYVLFTMQKVE